MRLVAGVLLVCAIVALVVLVMGDRDAPRPSYDRERRAVAAWVAVHPLQPHESFPSTIPPTADELGRWTVERVGSQVVLEGASGCRPVAGADDPHRGFWGWRTPDGAACPALDEVRAGWRDGRVTDAAFVPSVRGGAQP